MNIEVEVDTNSFEEPVGDRHEADFDGDLQILQPAKLFEKVGELFVYLLSIADDDAKRCFEFADRSVTAVVLPRIGLDGGLDQIRQLCEVSSGTAASEIPEGTFASRASRRG